MGQDFRFPLCPAPAASIGVDGRSTTQSRHAGHPWISAVADLTLPDSTAAKGFIAYDLDLKNDEQITAADKDGWRYHQGLPYDTRLLRKLINGAVDADGFYDMPQLF